MTPGITIHRISGPDPAMPADDQVRHDIDGPEKYCTRCHDWWPADTTFWYRKGSRLQSWCKACSNEFRTLSRPETAALPTAQPSALPDWLPTASVTDDARRAS